MNESPEIPDYLHCVICLDPVVCPYSFGCGHTVDAHCFIQLKKSECPKCRFKLNDVKRHGINLMLDALLREKIPNYDELSKIQMKYVKSIGLLKKYRKSSRAKKILSCCRKFITENQGVVKLPDLYKHVTNTLKDGTQQPEPENEDGSQQPEPAQQLEVRYLLSKKSDYHLISANDGNDYVVDLEDEEALGSVLRILKDKIDYLSIIKLLSWTFSCDEVENIGLSMRKTQFLTDEDSDHLINYLLELGDQIDKHPSEKKDSETEWTDSESGSGSGSGSDTGLESDDGSIGGGLFSILFPD